MRQATPHADAQDQGHEVGSQEQDALGTRRVAQAGAHARADRRAKRVFRNLWTIQINAAVRRDMSYSKFIHALKERISP